MIDILWASAWMSESSYANQARMIVPRLIKQGYNVAVLPLAMTGRMLKQCPFTGVPILPLHHDFRGNDIIIPHFQHTQPKVVISFYDVWELEQNIWGQLPWIPMVPIDHDPIPDDVLKHLENTDTVIAISKHGQRLLEEAGKTAHYVPCAVDPDIWQHREKKQSRRNVGFPIDEFIVSFVGVNHSNPSRKNIPRILQAWKVFSEKHDDAKLYLHTSMTGFRSVHGVYGGINIPALVRLLKIDPKTIIMADQYYYNMGLPMDYLVNIANATDVLLSPSGGEGSGIVPLEFQRIGVPVIMSAWTAQKEQCYGGWLLGESDKPLHERNDIILSAQGSYWHYPDIDELIATLDYAYNEWNNGDIDKHKRDAISGARKHDIDVVMNKHMLPTIENINRYFLMRDANENEK